MKLSGRSLLEAGRRSMRTEQEIQRELHRLEERVRQIDHELKRLPKENIYCCKNGNGYKWYETDGHTSHYISKKNRDYAELLAYKKYLLEQKADLQNEIRSLGFYLRHHSSKRKGISKLLENPAYAELLSPYFKSFSQELLEWEQLPFEHNESYREDLKFKTPAGICVRSKSEAYIVSRLYEKRIPFRYECALELGDQVIFPDFTMKHPVTGEVYYWEHLGMMEEPKYQRRFLYKMQLYTENNIFPGINLILTSETLERPLDFGEVDRLLEIYFL